MLTARSIGVFLTAWSVLCGVESGHGASVKFVHLLNSTIVKDQYRIYVALPDLYDADRAEKYPVVYLLDADWYFDLETSAAPRIGNGVVGITDYLAQQGIIPEVIVVGVGYPTDDDFGPYRGRDFHAAPQQFRQFLAQELHPAIEGRYNAASEGRVLLGHSSGGYFTLHDLLRYPSNIFESYVAVSGNYDYDAPGTTDGWIFFLEEQMYQRVLPARICDVDLYVAVGGAEAERFLRAHEAVTQRIESRGYVDLRWGHDVFEGLDHRGVVGLAFREGLERSLGITETVTRPTSLSALKARFRPR
jgi:predicted alpha/beta superfamily hydrolase